MIKEYIDQYLAETKKIIDSIDRTKITAAIELLQNTKNKNGRLFILGVGGSAANASHAVNDFRKILGLQAYTPVDNVSELTAWTNDQGFEFVFVNWLKVSRLNRDDAILVLSVGGGTDATSKNLVLGMEYAKETGASIVSIVSRDGGKAFKLSNVCILIPVVSSNRITAYAESWQ